MNAQVDGRRWKELYRAAVLNPRSSDVSNRIATAERAILSRGRELLAFGVSSTDERDELDEALYLLRAWKTSQGLRKTTAG